MSLPDINFHDIRQHRRSQADAFEELCCQLANDELYDNRISFVRKGRGGDAGIECFATLSDGTEIGWQVKFYSDFKSMLTSLDESLTSALSKHPKMVCFIACFPFDLSDSRKEGVETALARWDEWRDERIRRCKVAGRIISIDRWDAHELKLRLTESNARSAGRVAFWFDRELLTNEWLGRIFGRVADSLGERYSPESHIDIPLRQTLLAALRDPAVFDELLNFADKTETRLRKVPADDDGGAIGAAFAAAAALRQAGLERPEPFPLTELTEKIDTAAELALAWHPRIEHRFRRAEKPHPDVTAVSNLVGILCAAGRALRSERWHYIDSRALLVVGDAGTGKSHLLADACDYQLKHNRPAIMILGGKLPDAEPWGEILRDLDLPRHLQVRHFLGALNAAGEATGVRTLVAIDALNEKNGQFIWLTRLPGLLNDLREFPWITTVLSCRSTYVDMVIPSSLDVSRLPRVEHKGFSDHDVVCYLARKGISVPETPHQLEELRNPLFLRLACESFSRDGENLMQEDLVGISAVLDMYNTALSERVERTLGVAPARRIVRKAVAVLTKEMADTGRGHIGYNRADDLLRTIHNGQEMAHDLLFQLANEGLLAIEPDIHSSTGDTEVVRFEFERVGDHAISANLLDRSLAGGLANLFKAGTPLCTALSDTNSSLRAGLLEALAVQLPERLHFELPDIPGIHSFGWTESAFIRSLLTRQPSAFSKRTWELVEETGDDFVRYETLIALATEPGHPFNVHYLDTELRKLTMPERDTGWTIHLAHSERAMHLVDWAWNADQPRVTQARAELTAIQLAWFLTATRRALRDCATKALVALLANRPDLGLTLWDRFKDVDDGYVTERVVASLYGAAMQGRWEAVQLSNVALNIYRDLFKDHSPPVNVLLRDHALGLINYALCHGAQCDTVYSANLTPPFKSPWPIEYVSDETIKSYQRSYGNRGSARDEIVNSCIDGDFGRYVLDPAVQNWSPAPIGTVSLPTALDLREEWYEKFKTMASAEMLEAHEALLATISRESPDNRPLTSESRSLIHAAKLQFKTAVGSDVFEEWRSKAEYWRADGMYQRMARREACEFNLAWARRWVVMRAHELGWNEELHGNFDIHVRGSRTEHSLERIGKKYQWLALYELVARMGDNLASLPYSEDDLNRLRNLDPSLLVKNTSDISSDDTGSIAFWAGVPPVLTAREPGPAIAWLHSEEDILDGVDVIAVTSPEDNCDWLVLSSFEIWRKSSSAIMTESWRRVSCVVVDASEFKEAIALLTGNHLTSNHDLPSAEVGGYRAHLGEFSWRGTGDNHSEWVEDWAPYGADGQAANRIAILPTTVEYSQESVGYDCSISDNIDICLPARWIMQELGLKLKDGRSLFYQDANSDVTFWDPSVSQAGRSAGLIDRSAFLRLLKNKGLVAIWAVAGEKSAYSEGYGDGFGGRFTFTRLYHSDGEEVRALPRYDTFDKPSKDQLTNFLGDDDKRS